MQNDVEMLLCGGLSQLQQDARPGEIGRNSSTGWPGVIVVPSSSEGGRPTGLAGGVRKAEQQACEGETYEDEPGT